MLHILKCPACKKYSLKQKCSCGKATVSSKPPKYSTEDAYAKYRRIVKKENLSKEGLL